MWWRRAMVSRSVFAYAIISSFAFFFVSAHTDVPRRWIVGFLRPKYGCTRRGGGNCCVSLLFFFLLEVPMGGGGGVVFWFFEAQVRPVPGEQPFFFPHACFLGQREGRGHW